MDEENKENQNPEVTESLSEKAPEKAPEKEVSEEPAEKETAEVEEPAKEEGVAVPAAELVKEAVPSEILPELPPEAKTGERRWYVIFVHTGYEHRVQKSIEERINNSELGQKVFRVLVPEEEIIELRQNRRVERMKKMFPGYVFIEMILDDETWYKIRRISGVSKFIGAHKLPAPVLEKEIQRVLRQIGLKEETIFETDFEKGEGIRIISGPFRGYLGTIDETHPEKGKLRALISIFGRDTPVELDFSQVEKA